MVDVYLRFMLYNVQLLNIFKNFIFQFVFSTLLLDILMKTCDFINVLNNTTAVIIQFWKDIFNY